MLALLARLLAPPTQTLHTLRPTPSTVSYTVSTRHIPTTLLARLLSYVGVLVRVLLGVSVLLGVWIKYKLYRGNGVGGVLGKLGGPQTTALLSALDTVGWLYTIPGALIILFLVLRRGYTEESLTLLPSLGLQLSSSPPTYLQSARTRFLPSTHVQDIFIHEAFRGFEVRFYLAIVVKGEEDVVVVFPGLLPRRDMLEEVWRGARGCLWEGKERGSQE